MSGPATRRRGNEAAAVVPAVIQLGHPMGIRITAESAETAAGRDLLAEAGTDKLQDLLFAQPLDEERLRDWMTMAGWRLGPWSRRRPPPALSPAPPGSRP